MNSRNGLPRTAWTTLPHIALDVGSLRLPAPARLLLAGIRAEQTASLPTWVFRRALIRPATSRRLTGLGQRSEPWRYAHLYDDPLRKAVETFGAVIANAGKPTGSGFEFPRRGRRRSD